jgi:outer membrane lipoprotein-sorting protein
MAGSVLAGHAQTSAPPALDNLLTRAAAYVADYEAKFSAVVAEENYRQTADRVPSLTARRQLKSDVLVLNTGASGWMGFRDVYEIDGRSVRDHDARLSKLFVDNAADTMTHARQIADESARYNLGSVKRNINIPTMALSYLRRENLPRSNFQLDGTAKIDGIQTAVLNFTERARPTIIHSGDADAPATGRFWIDDASGRIVRSQLKLTSSKLTATITVSYATVPKLDIWVPVSMTENYRSPGENISGNASYSNFRRFNVDVATIIK